MRCTASYCPYNGTIKYYKKNRLEKPMKINKYMIVFIVSFLFPSICLGCSRIEGDEGSENLTGINNPKNTVNMEATVSPAPAKVATSPSIAGIKKKYPQWFDQQGQVRYPVSQDSKKWKTAKSHSEMVDMAQIPEEIVNSMDTEDLLAAVEQYPLFDFSIYDTLEIGLKQMKEEFYALDVLLRRDDAGVAASKHFLAHPVTKKQFEKETLFQLNCILIEEYLISREGTYQQLSKEEREKVLAAIWETEGKIEGTAMDFGPLYNIRFTDMLESGNPWKDMD